MELNDLLAIDSIHDKPQELQLDIIGSLFDLSFDHNRLDGLDHAFSLAAQIDPAGLDKALLPIFYYDLSNGWSYYRKIKYHQKQESWLFQMEELTKEIFFLRKAIACPGFEVIAPERKCQIFTNLGNSFSFIGRFVEAQAYFQMALKIIPDFAMAIGNMANGQFYYGRILYDNIHANLFMANAFHLLKDALRYKKGLHPSAAYGFQQMHDWLEQYISGNFPAAYLKDFPELNDFDLGEQKDLKDYRLWCLSRTLFVNPLNDLGPHTVASHDCLNLPTVTLPANRPPVCVNLFNQIKQEFATARYAFYMSISNTGPHLSDEDVPLIETMESIRYSYYIEQLKIAFRLSYSILDKIAYLLNDYLELNIALSKVSFRSLWYDPKKQLHPFFVNSENWALRGLFWLSKDLYEKDMDYDAVLEPDAQEIAAIRNFIEHKGFKIVSDSPPLFDVFSEPDISYSITRSAFEQKTMKLLKLTRAAIMYTALAISHEEQRKVFDHSKSMPVTSNTVPRYTRI